MNWEDKLEKMKIKHALNGWEFAYHDLRQGKIEVLKVYTDTSHFERKLVKHKETGKLFLYEFYEWEDFSGGNDEIYETFSVVTNEFDADKLNTQRDIKRVPYIFIDNDYNISVVE